MTVSTFPRAVSVQQASNERLDDIRDLLDDAGYGKVSRAEIVRALVFALPVDSADHARRILQVGRLRMYADLGHPWSEDALEEAEGLLGWYAEDVDRADLVREIEQLRREARGIRWNLERATKDLNKFEERVGPPETAA